MQVKTAYKQYRRKVGASIMSKVSNIVYDCKKLLGLPPFNHSSNICVGDPHFYKSLCNTYGELNVVRTIKELNN